MPKRTGRPVRDFIVLFELYSADGKRCAEVRLRSDGKAYFVERERVAGDTYKDRGAGEEIGPYDTSELAEAAAVARPWFNGRDSN